MREIHLWALDLPDGANPTVERVETLSNTDTVRMLEDVLVGSPSLLEPGLVLVGRQLPTENGPLDLIGVDANGRLVIFELKRGMLARDVVAQILDYASDLDAMERDALARHLETRSGASGIQRIEDFNAWYNESFPENNDEFSLPPRMVLVGLGIDSRARRMVRFLATAGIEIDVLTFHAFVRGGQTFLARQVEVTASESRKLGSTRGSKNREDRERTLTENAQKAGVHELLEEMRDFVKQNMKTKYRGGPRKGGVTFYKRAWAEDPKGPGRAYAGIEFDSKSLGIITFILNFRALRDGGEVVRRCIETQDAKKTTHWPQQYDQYEFEVDKVTWPAVREWLEPVLVAIDQGVKQAAEEVVSAEADA